MEEGLLVIRTDGSVQAFDSVAERLLGLATGTLRIGAALAELIDCAELYTLLSQARGRPRADDRMSFADLPATCSDRALLVRWTMLSEQVADEPSLLLKIRASDPEGDAARSLVARLSRELRAPVAAIRGCSATLLGGALDEFDRARRFVEMVQDNATQLEQIADDLSALAQVDPGWIAQHSSSVEVSSLLSSVVLRLGGEGVRRGVGVRSSASQRLMVAAVPQLLERTLLGILSELLRAAGNGEEITCELLVGGGDDTAQITMRRRNCDSAAPGGPAANQDLVSEDAEGGSLCIVTVRDVVRAHGGRASFQYSAGRLERVRVHWPLWSAERSGGLECYDSVTSVKFG
jgi:signal transduction histidine kinase